MYRALLIGVTILFSLMVLSHGLIVILGIRAVPGKTGGKTGDIRLY